MANRLIISENKAVCENDEYILSCSLSGSMAGCCFFSVPSKYQDYVDATRSDCFMVGLLYTAMFDHVDMEIRGIVSEKLLFTLNTYVIPMLNGLDPRLGKIKIYADATTNEVYPDAIHNGTGFSGGIDSFYTIFKRGIMADMPKRFKIDNLFFFNVGAHGMGSDIEKLKWLEDKFRMRFNTLKNYADEVNMEFISVNSNLHSFHQSGHLQTDTLASIGAALFVSRKLAHYYLGSPGYDYYTQIRCPNTQNSEIALINDLLLPHLATESFLPIADGAEFSRFGKTKEIVDYEPLSRYLNVCGNPETLDKNCSVCFKCKRSMLIFDILGVLERFKDVFDLSKFTEKNRRRYIAEVLNNRQKDLFCEDICTYAEKYDYDLHAKTSIFLRYYMRFSNSKLANSLRKIKNHYKK